MKKIFYLLFISFVLTTFVNATEMTAQNVDYTIWVEVKDKPNNHKDWIGIYPKNASNSWSNVIEWKWARDGVASPDKPNTDEYRFFNIGDGDYEARFFLNNTYKTEYKAAFSVFDPHMPSINIVNTAPAPNENIPFNLRGILSGDRDWVGIYPENASNDWSNVLTWRWAENRDVTLTGVPAGQYEARLFFHDSFNLEAKVAFEVENNVAVNLTTTKASYAVDEDISVNIENQATNNRNWIGIYPADSSNAWGNVLTWEWTNGTDSINIDGVPAGNYEARLFYNNSFQMEAKVAFSVEDDNTEFWQKGAYEVAPIIEVGNNGLVYHPKNLQGKSAPVVFVVKNHSSPRKKMATLINFIASHGFYVVLIDPSVAGSDYYTEPKTRIAPRYIEIVNYLKENAHNIDTSKIGVVGSSYSGGNTFPVLHRLKEEGYGTNASFILAIESANAFQMSKVDMRSLSTNNTYITLLEYDKKGNLRPRANGQPNVYSTDALFPLINFLQIKAANNLKNIDFQVFEEVGIRGHLYHQDTSIINGQPGENYQHMKGVLNPLGALMQLVLNKDNQSARSVALNQGSDNPIKDKIMEINPFSSYSYDCQSHDDKYNRFTDIKYFNDRALEGNREYIQSIEQLDF